MTTRRIFITDLASYNEGLLSGRWVDLPMAEDELEEIIKDVLRVGWEESQAAGLCCCDHHEEWFITDYEGFWKEIDEYENILELNEEVEMYEEITNNISEEALNLILEDTGYTLEGVKELVNSGRYIIYKDVDNEGDVAYQAYEEYGRMEELPLHLECYIDWEKVGRDMFIQGMFVYDWNEHIAIEIW